jgi:hypothetical protein
MKPSQLEPSYRSFGWSCNFGVYTRIVSEGFAVMQFFWTPSRFCGSHSGGQTMVGGVSYPIVSIAYGRFLGQS